MTTHLRRVAAAALCAGAALALTACSSSGGAATTASSAGPAGSASSSAPADPTAGLPNGTKLAGYLLPAGAVPHLKADTAAGANSGDMFVEPSDSVVPKAKACQQLGRTDWLTASGVGPASYAGNDFSDSYGNEYYQELDAYQGARAPQAFAAVKKVFTECRTFPAKVNGGTYTMHIKLVDVAGLGDEAVEAVITSPSLEGGETLVVARTGKMLVTTMYNDQKTTGGKALTLARELLKKVPVAAS